MYKFEDSMWPAILQRYKQKIDKKICNEYMDTFLGLRNVFVSTGGVKCKMFKVMKRKCEWKLLAKMT